ncbi:hypothetical protein [Salimicrobium halophilum]|uniref:Uncharacterized protein n=1 Tax=Salimicrobium halophilum TaxID=86666 RepID=A0A1G8UDA9_9BACI|nr:hypothetical protein [Salimicrobium halophilum]SDJ51737.1 hypothetical protein SAMN04490247_2191 [Salimicrobium halophilum]
MFDLNNREIAIIVWTVITIIFLYFYLKREGNEKVLKNVVSAFLNLLKTPLAIIILIFLVAISALLWYLEVIGSNLIKDYIKMILFGFMPMVNTVVNNYREINITNMATGLIKFSIIPMFIINEYTFNLYIELILVPVLSFLGVLLAVAGTKQKYFQVEKLVSWMVSLIGIYIAFHAFTIFFYNINDIKQVIFWKKMFLELLLLAHIPVLLFIKYAIYYNNVLVWIKMKSNLASNSFKKSIVLMIIFKNCFLNTEKLEIALSILKQKRATSFRDLNEVLSQKLKGKDLAG